MTSFPNAMRRNFWQYRTVLKNAADAEWLPFGVRVKTFNNRLAQELGEWVESLG